ncbi:MAG: hypothetical protein HY000_22385 [Planctomycetes bacterium]|nr:hypothetical protein [Planctomycetota bacterium]
MKRSRAALTFFLTTFGLSLFAIGSTCNRSGAADATPDPSCTRATPESTAEACSSRCSTGAAAAEGWGAWCDDWQPIGAEEYDSLKRNARAAITGLFHLIAESAAAPTEEDGTTKHTAAVAPQDLPEVYGCEGYDSDVEWYGENDSLAEAASENSVQAFHTLAAWRDLSSLAADLRHSTGQQDVDDLNAANDGLGEEALSAECTRPWHVVSADHVVAGPNHSDAAADQSDSWDDGDCYAYEAKGVVEPAEREDTSDSPAIAEGLDCDFPYCGNHVASAGRADKVEFEWEFDQPAADQPVAESSDDLRPAILATARILEQLGGMLSGWGRELHRAIGQTDGDLTAVSERDTWGL